MENINTRENWNRYHKNYKELNYPDKFKFISRELLNLPDCSKVLELGCGRGLLLEQIKTDHPTFILKGMDFSSVAVEETRKRKINAEIGILPDYLKIKNLKEWNAVIGTELLEHFPEDERLEVIKNVYKILLKGGKAIFTVPDNILSPFEEPSHFVCYNKKTFRDFLKQVFPIGGVISRKFLVSDIPHPNPKKKWGVCPFLFGTGYKDG